MTTIKEWLNANVWDGEDRSGCKTDSAVFNPDELLNLVTDCIAATQPQWVSVEERLPDHNVCVDVWGEILAGYDEGDSGRYENVFYDAEIGDFWTWHEKHSLDDDGEPECEYQKAYFKNSIKVIHWMPLPPEPEK